LRKIKMLPLNTIHNIDCLKGFRSLEDDSVQLILTDIPYAVVNRKSNGLRRLDKKHADVMTFDLKPFLSECLRVSSGSIYIFCGTEQVSSIRDFFVKAGLSTRLLVWEKTNPSPMNGDYIWLSGVEVCVFAKLPRATFNAHCKNTVLRYPTGRSTDHPTEKPLLLFKYLVEVSSDPDDLVLDPCMGSGTTAVACLETGRRFVGFELNKSYWSQARKRIEQWHGSR
jgi:site-specific DNA-methyltransferase (adenine-specific)